MGGAFWANVSASLSLRSTFLSDFLYVGEGGCRVVVPDFLTLTYPISYVAEGGSGVGTGFS